MILGIDAGNYEVKTAGELGLDCFYSDIGEYRERNLKNKHGKNDMVFNYNGRWGFAGSLARFESEFGGTIMGESKAHDDIVIRVLLAIHRYRTSMCETCSIVVGNPISSHTPGEKKRIQELLTGRHEITVNNERKIIDIEAVRIAPEGAAAFWSFPQEGVVRIIDVGSGTVNVATIINQRYVDRDSFTLNFGANTTKSNDLKEMARAIITKTYNWNSEEPVYLVGGVAEKLEPHLKAYFKNGRVIYPAFKQQETQPKFANSIGFYKLAKGVFK